jgi:hypothetical protein
VDESTDKQLECQSRGPNGKLTCRKKIHLLPYFYRGQFTPDKDPRYDENYNPDHNEENFEAFCPSCFELCPEFDNAIVKMNKEL